MLETKKRREKKKNPTEKKKIYIKNVEFPYNIYCLILFCFIAM